MTKVYISILFAMIFFNVGLMVNSVGEIPTCREEPYTWSAPILLFLMQAVPAVLGYFIGKDD